ncbi:glycine cleavage system H protein [Ferrithrix thermotolerans DSM 19514]|uniref:Glycine cleavage system H protein n=1 Tax=Ferrithrix thermotolerans DSM 19514 TaxID=1121881 RepID=A0A1M4WRF7_9ACTN|nr:glycine cleavage system protein H [Ferrithrix thermotolerans]SHE83737.1 glycine cleavage system H protein [Ferrithrix thermotolerans DSM 19514]
MAIQSWAGCVVPEDLLYDLDYDVWVKVVGETVSLGMTDVAQSRCGRLVQVSWKAPGKKVTRGKALSAIESAKWVGPFVSPVSGEILENNKIAFDSDVAISNRDPYGSGWFYRIVLSNPEELDLLVDGKEAMERYKKLIDETGLRCFRCEE